MGILMVGSQLFGVQIRALDFGDSPYRLLCVSHQNLPKEGSEISRQVLMRKTLRDPSEGNLAGEMAVSINWSSFNGVCG